MTVRLPRTIYTTMRSDLSRSHEFAWERVGFAYGRLSQSPEGELVLLHEYLPVPDEFYVRDESVGARIGSEAIRACMQKALSDGVSTFHVHEHAWSGIPRFSGTDLKGLSSLVPSLSRVAGGQAHGGLLLSSDRALARIWLPGEESPIESTRVVVVGFPLVLLGVSRHG